MANIDSDTEKIKQCVTLVNSDDPVKMLEGTIGLRKILCVEPPPLDKVFESGVVPRLISFLDSSAPHQLQYESGWCMSNLASGTTEHTRQVVEYGALLPLIQLILSPIDDVCEQGILAVGNITCDLYPHRNNALSCGILDVLGKVVQRGPRVGVLRSLGWTLTNLCKGTPPPPLNMLLPALGILGYLIKYHDEEVFVNAVQTLSYLTITQEGAQCIIESEFFTPLLRLMKYPDISMVPALRSICNISSGNDIQTQAIIDGGALETIFKLMRHPKQAVRGEAFWIASNVAAGNPNQIQSLINLGFFPEIVRIYNEATTHRQKIIWIFSNATNGTPTQKTYLLNQGILTIFSHFLTSNTLIKETIDTLKGIQNILQHDKSSIPISMESVLENLLERFKDNPDILKNVNCILSMYFGKKKEQQLDCMIKDTIDLFAKLNTNDEDTINI